MSKNKIITILAAVVILCVVIITMQSMKIHNLNDNVFSMSIDMRRKNKQIAMHIDSLRKVQKLMAVQDTLWARTVKEQFNLLLVERAKTNKMYSLYEKSLHTRVPYWTVHELDSLLESVLRHN